MNHQSQVEAVGQKRREMDDLFRAKRNRENQGKTGDGKKKDDRRVNRCFFLPGLFEERQEKQKGRDLIKDEALRASAANQYH